MNEPRSSPFSSFEQAFSLGNGQDSALNWLRINKYPVAIFLISGIKLEGIITGFDPYCILLTDNVGNQQLIYKAKISTIAYGSNSSHGNKNRTPKNTAI